MDASTTEQPVIQAGWVRALLGLLLYLGANLLLQLGSFMLYGAVVGISAAELSPLLMDPGSDHYMLLNLISKVVSLTISVGLVYLLRNKVDKATFASLGLDITGRWPEIRQGTLLGGGLIAAGFLSLYWMEFLSIQGVHVVITEVAFAFVLMVMIAIDEELLVRGYILTNLSDSMHKYAALGVSSLIFAIMHLLNPSWTGLSVLNIWLAGMVLGVYYIHRQNLWFPIALHFSWNFFQGPVAGFEVSGLKMPTIIDSTLTESTWITGGTFGFEGSIIATLLLVMAFIWLERTYGRENPFA
ncbi:MAG: CPBP family intramembrane glutamic endopeptidase [Bacteroidota bacterium]